MVQTKDINLLLSKWKNRLNDRGTYSAEYLDALSDCIYELSNVVDDDCQSAPDDEKYVQFLFY